MSAARRQGGYAMCGVGGRGRGQRGERGRIIRPTVSIRLKLLLACICWGVTPTIGRVLASFEAPLVVVCGRFLVASLFLLWFMARARAFVHVRRVHWWRFAVLGATGIALHNGLLYKGLESTTAVTASLILALMALQTVVLEACVTRRLPAPVTVLGVVLGFLGTALVITDGDLQAIGALRFGFGEWLVFLSGLSWAIYTVVGRALLDDYAPLALTTYASVAGVAMMLPAVLAAPHATITVLSSPHAVALVFFLGFVSSALGFLWYSQAMLTLGAVGTAAFVNLVPVFGVVSAMVFLGERGSTALVEGALLVILGLALVNPPAFALRAAARLRLAIG